MPKLVSEKRQFSRVLRERVLPMPLKRGKRLGNKTRHTNVDLRLAGVGASDVASHLRLADNAGKITIGLSGQPHQVIELDEPPPFLEHVFHRVEEIRFMIAFVD